MTREDHISIVSCTYGARGSSLDFTVGAMWADNHPKSPWIEYSKQKPSEGVEVIAYHPDWVDEDFNPNGTRIGFLNDNDEFTSAYWWDYHDCYTTINRSICEHDPSFYESHLDNTEPEYWMPIPKPPREYIYG